MEKQSDFICFYMRQNLCTIMRLRGKNKISTVAFIFKLMDQNNLLIVFFQNY